MTQSDVGTKHDTDDGSPQHFYAKGNESFVSEDYTRAIELYNSALSLDPNMAACFVARAHAYIKVEKYDLARKDADRAIDIFRSLNDTSGNAIKAHVRGGMAAFHQGKYKEAKNYFIQAPNADDGLKQWITWCDEKIKKFGEDASAPRKGSSDQSASQLASDISTNVKLQSDSVISSTEPTEKSSSNGTGTAVPEPIQSQNNKMPVPKIKHDWYQTETHVVIEVRLKNMRKDEVKIDIERVSLSVTAKLPAGGSEYSLELDLAHPILPEQSNYKLLSTKIEIRLKKAEGVRWTVLEGDGSNPTPGGAAMASNSATGLKAPYASGRDWSKLEKHLEEEADEKKSGDAALNEMFQKIYADASDETKMAMNKSFLESGGTVLSTNWSEVGQDQVKVQAPDGMEWKKWEN